MKTGEKCAEAGVYDGTCANKHTEELRFRVGDLLTPCSECKQVMTWKKRLSGHLH